MWNIEQAMEDYMNMVVDELDARGLTQEQIQLVMQKARFQECLRKFPEESIHYPVAGTADEILQVAAVS